jgi:hypothetical protein
VRKNLATLCLAFAWLCATGAVSDVAQVFAWGRMFVGYTRVLSVSAALTQTFDAKKPCELCLAVKQTRGSEDSEPRATLAVEKLFLACSAAPSPVIVAPPAVNWPDAANWRLVARTDAVPTRPPRA